MKSISLSLIWTMSLSQRNQVIYGSSTLICNDDTCLLTVRGPSGTLHIITLRDKDEDGHHMLKQFYDNQNIVKKDNLVDKIANRHWWELLSKSQR